ncbi:MAG: guanylate kinase [Chitinophagaceae bacterium]|nr:guanylate kinase [Chitinophagaceae bacterium]
MTQSSGKILIITAPSGAGKTSVTTHLLQLFSKLTFSVSAATRLPRENEIDGIDYYFMTPEAFKQKIQRNEFIEWEMVYEGKYYGTLNAEMERIWKSNKIPVLDIDVKGAIHVQQQFPTNTLSIFIEPPSIDELKRRLQGRGTETKESLEARINKASYEISFKHSFSHTIINYDLDTARKEAVEIVEAFLNKP